MHHSHHVNWAHAVNWHSFPPVAVVVVIVVAVLVLYMMFGPTSR